MRKKILLFITLSITIVLFMIPKSHAYTLSNTETDLYNKVTNTVGTADVLDIGSNYIEYQYYNLPNNTWIRNQTLRVVFSNQITTELLPNRRISGQPLEYRIQIYTLNENLHSSFRMFYLNNASYFEAQRENHLIDDIVTHITIRMSGFDVLNYEEEAHQIMNGAIIAIGHNTVINQTINTVQYENGWNDAMNSKIEQIWSLWDNIFNTFMGVFSVFSVKLIGDITIGHIALVPLVLGLIGFIYALGGKRGR